MCRKRGREPSGLTSLRSGRVENPFCDLSTGSGYANTSGRFSFSQEGGSKNVQDEPRAGIRLERQRQLGMAANRPDAPRLGFPPPHSHEAARVERIAEI